MLCVLAEFELNLLKKSVGHTDDEYFKLSTFDFWGFYLDKVEYKVSFNIIVSNKIAHSLNIIGILETYNIEFDKYLVTKPSSRNITIDALKPDLPIAYFARIIDSAEKNEAIISLHLSSHEYLFKFEFLK